MKLNYQQAVIFDLDLLVNPWGTVLRTANRLDDSLALLQVRENPRIYYETTAPAFGC